MKGSDFSYVLTCVAVSALAGCGGLQPLVGTPGAMPQSHAIATRDDLSPSLPKVGPPRNVPDNGKYRVIFTFGSAGHGSDGAFPTAGLLALNGNLYGTGETGGQGHCYHGCGTVFSITTTGKVKLLHTFDFSDGADPAAELTTMNGVLFGTTLAGGAYGGGTVFRITPNGKEKVLHSFGKGADGAVPSAGLAVVSGTLYGTTSKGGTGACSGGCGTVFSLNAGGAEKILHSFRGSPDGQDPIGTLAKVGSTLYGTTSQGGSRATHAGTVFSVSTSGKENVLFSFGNKYGANPEAGLLAVKDKLYGTTYLGGSAGYGTVFSISTTGAQERVLHNFSACCSDGVNPWARLVAVRATLYGTTWEGGTGRVGTVFSVDEKTGSEKVLHNFGVDYMDGALPQAGLVEVNGELYGTTYSGGRSTGTVFGLEL